MPRYDYESPNIEAAAYLAREDDPGDDPRDDFTPEDAEPDTRTSSHDLPLPYGHEDFLARMDIDTDDYPF